MRTARSISSSMPPARRRTISISRRACRPSEAGQGRASRAARAAGSRGRAGAGGDRARRCGHGLHEPAHHQDRRRSRPMSAAPAIRARTATRSRLPPAASANLGHAAARSRGEADRPRRARFAAARGRALPLRPRHRHHDLADRRRAGLVDPEAPPRGGRLSRRRPDPARTGGRSGAHSRRACCRRAALRRAKARRSPRPRARSSASSPPAASARR